MRMDWFRGVCALLCALAAHAAWAQPQRAKVAGDPVKVYLGMSTRSDVVGELKAGEVVQVGMSITGEEGSWCGVARIDPPASLGYVRCSALAFEPRPQAPAPAVSPNARCSVAVDKAFKAWGVSERLAAIPAEIRSAGEAQLQTGLGPTAKRRVLQAVSKAFSQETLGARIKREFVDWCDLEMLAQVTAGLTAPRGASMVEMEISAASRQGDRQMSAFAASLTRHPPLLARMDLMEKLDQSLGTSDFLTDLVIAFDQGLNEALDEPSDMDEATTTQISDAMHKIALVNLLFTYRGASEEEIAQYIELNETQPFRRFSDRFRQAFVNSVDEQARLAGLEMNKPEGPRSAK